MNSFEFELEIGNNNVIGSISYTEEYERAHCEFNSDGDLVRETLYNDYNIYTDKLNVLESIEELINNRY